jgi:hypothetical protein
VMQFVEWYAAAMARALQAPGVKTPTHLAGRMKVGA